MNALAHVAPRVAPRRGKHASSARPRVLGRPRPVVIASASLCCTVGLMCALYLVATTAV